MSVTVFFNVCKGSWNQKGFLHKKQLLLGRAVWREGSTFTDLQSKLTENAGTVWTPESRTEWTGCCCTPFLLVWTVKAYTNCFPSFHSSSVLQIPWSFSKIYKGLLLLLEGLKISLSPFFYLKMGGKWGIEWEDVKMSNRSNDLSEHLNLKPKWERVETAFGNTVTKLMCCLYVGMYHLKLHSAIYF